MSVSEHSLWKRIHTPTAKLDLSANKLSLLNRCNQIRQKIQKKEIYLL